MTKEFVTKFANIQKQVNVEKNGFNGFGKYNYRTIDDMLLKIKPLLAEAGMVMFFTDEIIPVGKKLSLMTVAKEAKWNAEKKMLVTTSQNQELREVDRIILKTTITVTDGENQITNSAYADIDPTASMSDEQKVGAASTYARKYALNGMFAIDDGKLDPDANKPDDNSDEKPQSSEKETKPSGKTKTSDKSELAKKATIDKMIAEFEKIGISESDVFKHFGLTRDTVKNSDISNLRTYFLEQKTAKQKAS